MSDDTKQKLMELNNTSYGKALREYLDSQLKEIQDITKAKTWEETQGRQLAVKLIHDLFRFMEAKKVDKIDKVRYY
jgi:hypothetical protein